MKKPSEIITDAEVMRVHANARFGSMTPREVVDKGTLKTAFGYHCGSTMQSILLDHKLTKPLKGGAARANLTPKGWNYFRALMGDRDVVTLLMKVRVQE